MRQVDTMNPIKVFFGNQVVANLKDQPGSLKRIAERVKPLLMGAFHPDRNPDHKDKAAEVSEAYSILTSASKAEILIFIEEFLSIRSDKGHKDKQKELTRQHARTQRDLESAREESRILKDQLTMMRDRFVQNLNAHTGYDPLSLVGYKKELMPTNRIPVGMIHHYRMVVEVKLSYGLSEYRAFEFMPGARVRKVVVTVHEEDAFSMGLLRGSPIRRTKRVDKQSWDVLVGSGPTTGLGQPLLHALLNGTVEPLVTIGNTPAFFSPTNKVGFQGATFNPGIDWKILALIPLKEWRALARVNETERDRIIRWNRLGKKIALHLEEKQKKAKKP